MPLSYVFVQEWNDAVPFYRNGLEGTIKYPVYQLGITQNSSSLSPLVIETQSFKKTNDGLPIISLFFLVMGTKKYKDRAFSIYMPQQSDNDNDFVLVRNCKLIREIPKGLVDTGFPNLAVARFDMYWEIL